MNVIATGDESGIIYEKLFVPETNQLKKGNSVSLFDLNYILDVLLHKNKMLSKFDILQKCILS